MADYDPLEAYLARHGAEEVELSVDEVERIVGGSLPMSARRPQWWANDSDQGQNQSWRAAGYGAFLLTQGRVLFRRRKSDTSV
jgi:hypothetical protein